MNDGRQRKTGRPARALGWAGLGLGAAQLAAPNAVRRITGVDDSAPAHLLVPLAGVRELCQAAVLLGSRVPGPWVWTRVAGDAADLAVLGLAAARRRGVRRRRAAVATAAVAGIAAVDLATALRRGRRPWDRELTLHAEHPERHVRDDLRRFKQIMETGEVLRAEGGPEGVRAMPRLRRRPAQPVTTGGTP